MEALVLVAWLFGHLERSLTLEEVHILCSKIPEPKPGFVRVLEGVQNTMFLSKGRDLAIDDLNYEVDELARELFYHE